MAQVIVYSRPNCSYCVRAKRLLDARGVPYVEVDASDAATRDELVRRTGRFTLPQIFVGDDALGGYDELAGLDRRDGLAAMLADAGRS